VDVVLDEGEAVRHAVATAQPGTLVLVLYERYDVVCQAAREALAARGGAEVALASAGRRPS
jgi:methylmalonyl-CoA mutase cobalamin-binding subunit